MPGPITCSSPTSITSACSRTSSNGSRPTSEAALARAPAALPPLWGRTDLRHLVAAGAQLPGVRVGTGARRTGLLAGRVLLQSDGGGDAVRCLGAGVALVDV